MAEEVEGGQHPLGPVAGGPAQGLVDGVLDRDGSQFRSRRAQRRLVEVDQVFAHRPESVLQEMWTSRASWASTVGRVLARLIPGARFVPLDGQNHMLLARDAAFAQFVAQIDQFTGT